MFLTTELGIGENPMLNIAFPNDYHHTNSDLNNLAGVGCFNIIKVNYNVIIIFKLRGSGVK